MNKLNTISRIIEDEKNIKELIEIKGFNICEFYLNKKKLDKDRVTYMITGKFLRYKPKLIDTVIQINQQEAFDLAIDIISQNPLLLFAYFKQKFSLNGDNHNGKEKKKTTETKSESVLSQK